METLDVPSLVATALIVPGSPTSTTTFYVNFSVISARTGGSRWAPDLLAAACSLMLLRLWTDATCRWITDGTFFCQRRRFRIMSPLRTRGRTWIFVDPTEPVVSEEVNAPCIQPWEVRSPEIPSTVRNIWHHATEDSYIDLLLIINPGGLRY